MKAQILLSVEMVLHPEEDENPMNRPWSSALNTVTSRILVHPILEFYAENWWWGSYTGLDLFCFWSLEPSSPVLDLTTFQMLFLCGSLPFYGSHELCTIFQGHILHYTRKMPDIAVLYGWCNIRVHQLYEADSFWLYASTAFTDHLPIAPVPCALSLDGNHFRLFRKILGFVGLLGSTSTMLTMSPMSKRQEERSRVGKWICVPEVVAVGHRCTYEGHYRGSQVQKIIDWPDCNTLWRLEFPSICSIVRIWVIFCQMRSPSFFTKKDTAFVWKESESIYEDLKTSDRHGSLPSADWLSHNWCVILAVNSSCIAYWFHSLSNLAWMTSNTKPFGSITWNNQIHYPKPKSRYLVSGMPLGLPLYIIVSKIFESKLMQAISRYAQQSGHSTRHCSQRWIVAQAFQFELVHVPGCLHTAWMVFHTCCFTKRSINEDEDPDDWLDRTMKFCHHPHDSGPAGLADWNFLSHQPTSKTLPTY